MKKRIGIQGFLLFFSLAMSILLSKILFPVWQRAALDEFLDCFGICMILTGFLFRICARGYKSQESDNGNKLVVDGPYSLIRHPMYFGTLLIGLGVILVLFDWWIFPIFLAVFLLIYIPEIKKEEIQLSERFGQKYKEYFNKTPKYFPGILNLFKNDFRNYLFFKLSWVRKEIYSLVGLLIVVIVLELWQDLRFAGHISYMREAISMSFVIVFWVLILSIFFKR